MVLYHMIYRHIVIIFNNEDGTLLIDQKYSNCFGFNDDIKESHDSLYLSTMFYILYCNANFIQSYLYVFFSDLHTQMRYQYETQKKK